MNEKAKLLISTLRAMDKVPIGTPFLIPGDGEMIWDYGEFLVDIKKVREGLDDDDFLPYDVPKHWCGSVGCAMGVAEQLGIVPFASLQAVALAIGLPPAEAKSIFMSADYYNKKWKDVTPGDVAEALEAVFAVQEKEEV